MFKREKQTSYNLTFLPNDFQHLTSDLTLEPDSLLYESWPGIIVLPLQLAA